MISQQLKCDEFADAGLKRVNIGGALNWVAVYPLLKASKTMSEQGTLNWTTEMEPQGEVKQLFGWLK
ncbi:MAG: hypothetical protein OEQ39_24230 [Gammaproteobacteria bacterium]|nr:hypothetical protein [Gammaproteobacteria bacterium]MDH3468893.1 hypothetical protein [Gammaproteobacteria bacterium]